MDEMIKVKCPNTRDCGQINEFPITDLVGEVPLQDQNGNRLPPPAVEIDDNTFVQCEYCGFPINCLQNKIS